MRTTLGLLSYVLPALLIVLAACAGGEMAAPGLPPAALGQESKVPAGEIPCEIRTILQTHCSGCHGATPAYGAPMALVTRNDLEAPLPSNAKERVVDGIVARLAQAVRPMPPAPNERVAPGDIAKIAAWAAAGRPAGGACDAPVAAAAPLQKPLSCTPDVAIRPATRAKIGTAETDQYVCYGFERKVDHKRHVIGVAPRVDNLAHVHHLLLFQTPEPLPGEPFTCSVSTSPAWKLMAGWAPGVGPLELPEAAGLPEEGTTHWALQVHYNNPQGLADQTDSSGFDLCTTDSLRKYDADMMATGSLEFSLPPRSSYDLSCSYRWGPSPTGENRDLPSSIHVFSVFPHMHKLGRRFGLEKLTSTIRSSIPIMAEQPFAFESQYHRPADIIVSTGDVLRTHCGWENSSDAVVSTGERTGDEMCFGFVMYYPRVTSRDWSWTTPSGGLGTVCEETVR